MNYPSYLIHYGVKGGWTDLVEPSKGITNDDRFWFICEDQTIGMATIADLVNQGKNKNEIIKTMKDANFIYINMPRDERIKDDNLNATFQLSQAYADYSYTGYSQRRMEDFIDTCIEIKNEEQNRKK